MNFDTRYLDTFVAVYETGGFARAAAQLHLTQSAVSHRIKRLERQMKEPLFDRAGSALRPTASAHRLHASTTRYFGEIAALQRNSGAHATGMTTIRVSAVSGFGRYVLFPVLMRVAQSRYRVDLVYRTANEVFDDVAADRCDVGFVYHSRVSTRLRLHPVYVERLVLIGPASEPDAPCMTLSAFESLPLITYEENDYVFGAWCAAAFGSQPRVTSSAHNFEELEEVVQCVAAGEGYSVVPADCVTAEVAAGRVRVIESSAECINTVYAVLGTRAQTAAVSELIAAFDQGSTTS